MEVGLVRLREIADEAEHRRENRAVRGGGLGPRLATNESAARFRRTLFATVRSSVTSASCVHRGGLAILARRLVASALMTDRTSDIFKQHLDGDFRVSPLAQTPVSREQIEAIGARFGVVYPAALADHICGRFPGIYLEVKEAIWPRPKPYDVGPFWSFLYGLHTFTSAPESEPWMRLDHAAETFRARTQLHAAPVLKIEGDADVYCVDANGALCRFRHETHELEPVEGDYWSLLDREVGELRARKDRKKAGG